MPAKQIRPVRRRRRSSGGRRVTQRWINATTMNISGLSLDEPSDGEQSKEAVATPKKQIKKQIKKSARPNVRVAKKSGVRKARAMRHTAAGRKGRMPAFFNKRYQLKEPIGAGGAGSVYKALDKVLNMDVAIKFLPERLSKKKDELAKFKMEASIAMKLSHRYIVGLHNLDISRGRYFLIMQYVNGHDFRSILQKYGKLSLDVALQVLSCCAEALNYAHEHNVVHRDLKPENLMLNEDSVLKIIDFGTACITGSSEERVEKFIEGTPPYMSPEQITGSPVDRRTDVYSLGIIAHEFLDGVPPFPIGIEPNTILETEPAPLQSVPEAVADVVGTAMARHADDRWETAGEFVDALRLAAEGAGIEV